MLRNSDKMKDFIEPGWILYHRIADLVTKISCTEMFFEELYAGSLQSNGSYDGAIGEVVRKVI